MCGICGIVGRGAEDGRGVVLEMCRTMAHRGPDDEGIASGQGWILGHRRLSIIDLSDHGHQPMANEDGTCWLAFNGEIYNFPALRSELVLRGHNFRSNSDSETIIHLFEDHGENAVYRLNGMFAFAALDARRRQLVLCRDRLGIKPLYYYSTGTNLMFASEIKALACHPEVKMDLDRSKVRRLLQFRYVVGPESIFSGVKELLPGHLLRVNMDTLQHETVCYWKPPLRADAPVGEKIEIGERLASSVKMQMISDAPLGCQLSGGLDSSLVTVLAVGHSRAPMHTFSVGFAGSSADESYGAQAVARHFGTVHHPVGYSESEFLEDLAHCAWLNDDPLNHPNSMPMYRMCMEARKYVKVLLTGEGADELFGGYSWHHRMWRLRNLGRMGRWRTMRHLRALAPAYSRLGRLADVVGRPTRDVAAECGKWVSDQIVNSVLHPRLPPQTLALRQTMQVTGADPLEDVLDMDLRTYLVSVLQRQDRMSMAAGVESRVPYLDQELVDAALRLPVTCLFEHGQGKAVLRRAARGLVPDDVIKRPKIGFRVPIGDWMRQGHNLAAVLGWLRDDRARGRALWQADRVADLVRRHREGVDDHAEVLWSLLSLEVWARLWLDGNPHEVVREDIQRTIHQRSVGAGPALGVLTTEFRESAGDLVAAAGEKGRTGDESQAPQTRTDSLNVLHVLPSLEVGGMERVVCDLLRAGAARGCKGFVFCTDTEGDLFANACAAAKACGFRKPATLAFNRHVVDALVHFVRANSIDVIHAHNHVGHLYGVLASVLTDTPVVVTFHGQGFYDTRKTLFLRRVLNMRTGMVVAVSEEIRDAMLKMSLVSEARVAVIRNGVDVKSLLNEPPELGCGVSKERDAVGIPRDSFVMGAVGRLSPEKNYPLLVRALARFRFRFPPAYLVLVGEGPDRERIERTIEECRVSEWVMMTGVKAEVSPWYRIMDVFCLSSLTEGTSMTLLEAGAAGLASVVTDVGGNAEIVEDGQTGIVVPSGDDVAMAGAFEKLAVDLPLRLRMGEAARRRVMEKYSLAGMVEKYLGVYKAACLRRRATPGKWMARRVREVNSKQWATWQWLQVEEDRAQVRRPLRVRHGQPPGSEMTESERRKAE